MIFNNVLANSWCTQHVLGEKKRENGKKKKGKGKKKRREETSNTSHLPVMTWLSTWEDSEHFFHKATFHQDERFAPTQIHCRPSSPFKLLKSRSAYNASCYWVWESQRANYRRAITTKDRAEVSKQRHHK